MHPEAPPSWSDILRGRNGASSLALAGGTALHATNIYLVTTIMPSVVQDIGGFTYYAMNTTMFILASIVGAVVAGPLAERIGGKKIYLAALALFSLAALTCATATTMPLLILGRTVEGLAGGVLVSMAYVLIRHVFPERLWTRAMGMISAMWGMATLSGPAIGGVFAEYGHWRWAFWSLQPVVLILAVIVTLWLPEAKSATARSSSFPFSRLILLTASVLAISIAGVLHAPRTQIMLVLLAMSLLAWMIQIDRSADAKILPTGSYGPTRIRAIYLTMSVLSMVTTVEIFIPFFLQFLHHFSPLKAGYLTSVMAGGWSFASMFSSGFGERRAQQMIRLGPLLLSVALVCFAWVVQQIHTFEPTILLSVMAFNLLCMGMGVGLAWPHLLSKLLSSVPEHEGAIASSSLSTVQMYAMSVGSALAGLIVNSIGGNASAEAQTVMRSAFWLFVLFGLLAFLGVFSGRRATRPDPSFPVPISS